MKFRVAITFEWSGEIPTTDWVEAEASTREAAIAAAEQRIPAGADPLGYLHYQVWEVGK